MYGYIDRPTNGSQTCTRKMIESWIQGNGVGLRDLSDSSRLFSVLGVMLPVESQLALSGPKLKRSCHPIRNQAQCLRNYSIPWGNSSESKRVLNVYPVIKDFLKRRLRTTLRDDMTLIFGWHVTSKNLSQIPNMDALVAKADAVKPLAKKTHHNMAPNDRRLQSVAKRTSVPKSFSKLPDAPATYKHIANKKLRGELNRHTAQTSRAKALLEDAEMLLMDEAGKMEVEGEMERTWRVGQEEIVKGAGQEAARGRREWKLDGGPYKARYTRNGRCVEFGTSSRRFLSLCCRHLAIAGRNGHVATFDWMTGTLHSELQLQETCRDITYVSQKLFLPHPPIQVC